MSIVKPEKMDFSNKNIIVIVSGLPGVGKTTLALSAPDVLLIDTDEGLCRIKNEHRKDASICKTYEEILADIKEAEGKYKTIVIDTAGALIDYMKDWAMRTEPTATKKGGGFSLQGFGVIKQEFLRLSADLKKKFNVVYVFHESMTKNNEDVFYELVCEGSARTLVYQPADLAGHVFIQNGDRYIGFTPTEQYSAKSAYGIKGIIKVPVLADGDPNEFLTKLFEQVRSNLSSESKQLEPQMAKYKAVMEQGNELIAAIKDAADATNCLVLIKSYEHALTSEKELLAAYKKKCADIGLKWDKAAKAWVNA